MEFFLLLLTAIINFILVIIISRSGLKNTINLSFIGLLVFVSVWAIGDILMLFSDATRWAQLGLYLFMIIPMFVSLSIVYFSYFFPNKKAFEKKDILWLTLATIPTVALTAVIIYDINYFVNFVSIGTPLNEYYVHAPYKDIYATYFTVYFIIYGALLVWKLVLSKGLEKKRILFLMLSLLLASIVAIVTNIIIPSNTHSLHTAWIGPLSSTLLIAATIFTILRYQLFNVRAVIFRLTAYSLSLGIITLLFILLAFNLTSLLFGGQYIPLNVQIYYMLTALLVALAYGPIKRFVDTGTNRLFYQQSYSVNEAINKISSFSTRSVDASAIQRRSLEVINETIRPDYSCFIVYDADGKLHTTTHSGDFPSKTLVLSNFLSELAKVKQKLTFVDDVSGLHNHMREYFELSKIGLVVRLATTNESIGYLVLGHKKNGRNYSQHDIQLLRLASNDLALALQNALAFEKIKEFNHTLQARVNKATAALKRTNEKLVALDDTKDEFISMASHQLRTPLTSVKGYISMMLEGDLGKITPTQRKALEEAFNSSQRMVFLISDFLNVSRIRTGKFIMEKDQTDLSKIVLEEISQLRDMAGLRDQTINYKPPKNFPIVVLDENKTRQVMMNFIDNAIFYTPKSGHIDITLQQTEKEILFEVTDSGIGVPKNVQHRLFTKFFRAENARNARPDGTGLGLFMGQKIIDAQGGKIIFHSVENQGSTFGFRFPIKIISKIDQKN
ncbi:MAG: ATP-binding protein [Candidatus Saccharibacteria bacterium]|nr:ATP-binding protein [Candidatus Saccharibacteria bacterium]